MLTLFIILLVFLFIYNARTIAISTLFLLLVGGVIYYISQKEQFESFTMSPLYINQITFYPCATPCTNNIKKTIYNNLVKKYKKIKYIKSNTAVKNGAFYFKTNINIKNGSLSIGYNGTYSIPNIINFLKYHRVKKTVPIQIIFKNNIQNNILPALTKFQSFIKKSGRTHSTTVNKNNRYHVIIIMRLENNGYVYYTANQQSYLKTNITDLQNIINNFSTSIKS